MFLWIVEFEGPTAAWKVEPWTLARPRDDKDDLLTDKFESNGAGELFSFQLDMLHIKAISFLEY